MSDIIVAAYLLKMYKKDKSMLNRSTYEREHPNTQFLFQTIYQAACRLDKNRHDTQAWLVINDLLSEGTDIDLMYNGISPIGLLAQEGKDKGVDILLNEFHARLSDAIECYAATGNKKGVDRLIEGPIKREEYEYLLPAIMGAAKGGQDDLVKAFIKVAEEIRDRLLQSEDSYPWTLHTPSLKAHASLAYAFAGNTNKVNEIGSTDSFALRGYARACNVNVLKQIISEYTEGELLFFANCIVNGFDQGGYLENCVRNGDTTILSLFAICDDASRAKIREVFKNGISKVGPPPGTPIPESTSRSEENLKLFNALIAEVECLMKSYQIKFSDAYKVHLFQSQYQLTADQAYVWLDPKVRLLLLEGIQKTNKDTADRIIPDIFFHIASFLTKVDDVETLDLKAKMHYGENKRLLMYNVQKGIEHETKNGILGTKHCRFFKAIANTKNQNQLTALLDKQNKGDKFYQQYIEVPHRRLKQG